MADPVRSSHTDQRESRNQQACQVVRKRVIDQERRRYRCRRDYAQLCWRLTQGVPATGSGFARTRQLVERYVSRSLQEPPALLKEEESHAARLREWLNQHP